MGKSILKWSVVAGLLLLGLFFWNGVNPAWKQPEAGVVDSVPSGAEGTPGECRVLAFNLGKLGFHNGGFDFLDDFAVRARVRKAAELIRDSDADIVCLSEVVFEGGPSGVNQLQALAEASGLKYWNYADNYSFGLPFYRIRSGNAILSRYPLRPLFVMQLPGSVSFFNPTNRRRFLMCEITIGGQLLRVGSVRNDSFDLANNAEQTQTILEGLKVDHVLLAGDFNAEPGDASIQLLKNSGMFSGAFDGPASFPSEDRRIDYVFGPSTWTLIEERLIENQVSDHHAVLAHFRFSF